MKIIKTFAICGLVSLGHLAVEATVFNRSVPATAIEGTNIDVRGQKLNSQSNPLKVTAIDEFNKVIVLESTSSDGRLLIRMPDVNQNTLMTISVSGGNRDVNNSESFVILVIDKPILSETVNGQDDFGQNETNENDNDTTPGGLAKNIENLPNLRFIGTDGQRTVFRSTIVGNVEGELRNANASLGLTGSGNVKLDAQGDAVLKLPSNSGTLATIADIGQQHAGNKVLENDGTEFSSNHYFLNLSNSNSVQLTASNSSDVLAKITGGSLAQKLTIVFTGPVQIETNNASEANTINLATASTIFTANDVLELFFNGTNWLEISRTINN